MFKSVALLSSESGVGKTTLALSLASIISRNNKKVLVVDCDFSTYKTTYFCKNGFLNGNQITSFYDILFDNNINELQFANISNNYDFIPACNFLSQNPTNISQCTKNNMDSFYNKLLYDYDIVLFDFQAGYIDIFEEILPNIKTVLIVEEESAHNSLATSRFKSTIQNIINEDKIYYVFNKLSSNEFNRKCKKSPERTYMVQFNYKTKRIFSRETITQLENFSIEYIEQLNKIVNFLIDNASIYNPGQTVQGKINRTLEKIQNKIFEYFQR